MTQNLLAQEKSPYLLQHQHNPVWWHPWGEAALARAKAEDKMIFLSVGYATCHWCHVMEGDSFEKEDVATILNEHFVSIKVDREERPDVDAIYMAAVQIYSGRGGWPMSVAMTPDGKPFWAGTFVPRQQFKHLLLQLARIWRSEEREKIFLQADEIFRHLRRSFATAQDDSSVILSGSEGSHVIQRFYQGTAHNFDDTYGGFGPAPKFPSAMTIMALLRLSRRNFAPDALKMVNFTLEAMAKGGIHDHIGGGFHRYSTDERWFAPHFEKMLYDNALLAMAYTEAFSVTQNSLFRNVAESTLAYLLRDMRDSQGGFYSAEDADSERTEGKFYVWRYEELQEILSPEEFKYLEQNFEFNRDGNFEPEAHVRALEEEAGLFAVHGANILHVATEKPLPDPTPELQNIREKLLNIRCRRIRPLLDDKVLADWNGLTVAAFAKAYQILQDRKYLDAATQCAQFLCQKMFDGTTLRRRSRAGEIGIKGLLTDYAATVFGLIELFYATADETWLNHAIKLQSLQNVYFFDSDNKCYFESDGSDPTLLFRNQQLYDNAVPSGNSLSVLNLIKLGELTADRSYKIQADSVVASTMLKVEHYPQAFPMMILALIYREFGGFNCLDGVCST